MAILYAILAIMGFIAAIGCLAIYWLHSMSKEMEQMDREREDMETLP